MSLTWSALFQFSARRSGKTYAMATLARELGAVLVCSNSPEALRVAKEHGIKTYSATRGADGLRGRSVPVLYDPDAVAQIAYSYEWELNRRAETERDLRIELHRMRERVAELSKECES